VSAIDRPPDDHGSDRYDYVEISGPKDAPLPEWLTADWQPCQDCRANAFLSWIHVWQGGGRWHLTVAHDDGCPVLAEQDDGS
jgi:hypothetical protein